MERQRDDRLPGDCGVGGQRQETHARVAGKGIGAGAKNGDVVPDVGGDDRKRKQLRRAVWTRHQNGGLAPVLECLEHVRDRQEVALIIDEERSEEHTSELQSRLPLVCRLLLEKKNKSHTPPTASNRNTAHSE